MAFNFASQTPQGGLVLLPRERVFFTAKGVELSITDTPKTRLVGFLYLTDHRVVFISLPSSASSSAATLALNFTMPLYLVHDTALQQPIFGSNYFTGIVDPLPDGGLSTSASFKLSFSEGGAIEFASHYLKASQEALLGTNNLSHFNQAYIPPCPNPSSTNETSSIYPPSYESLNHCAELPSSHAADSSSPPPAYNPHHDPK
eukprot:Sdes_comp19387_c0_seq2m10685